MQADTKIVKDNGWWKSMPMIHKQKKLKEINVYYLHNFINFLKLLIKSLNIYNITLTIFFNEDGDNIK